jgi:hypothetical protein
VVVIFSIHSSLKLEPPKKTYSAYCCISNSIGWSFQSFSKMYTCTLCFFTLLASVEYVGEENADWMLMLSNWSSGMSCKHVWTSVMCQHTCCSHTCVRYDLSGVPIESWYFLVGFLCIHCFPEAFHHGTLLGL